MHWADGWHFLLTQARSLQLESPVEAPSSPPLLVLRKHQLLWQLTPKCQWLSTIDVCFLLTESPVCNVSRDGGGTPCFTQSFRVPGQRKCCHFWHVDLRSPWKGEERALRDRQEALWVRPGSGARHFCPSRFQNPVTWPDLDAKGTGEYRARLGDVVCWSQQLGHQLSDTSVCWLWQQE